MMFFLLTVLILAWVLYDNYFNRRNLPPGPIRFPFFGNLLQLATWKDKKFPHVMMQNFSKRYGPISTLELGNLRQIIVDDPELMKIILQQDNWAYRPAHEFIMERSHGKPLGILFSSGEMNKQMRRFAIRTLRDFGFGKQKSQDAVMEEEMVELMGILDKKLKSEGGVVPMHQFFNLSILNLLWTMIAGERLSHDDAEFNKFISLMGRTMRLLSPGSIFMAYPNLRHLPERLTGLHVRHETIREVRTYFKEVLQKRRKAELFLQEQRDFIDVFLYEMEKNKGNKANDIFTEEQFVVTIMDLFGAGSETTANSLEFAFLYMIKNPQVQQKVHEEIDRVLGRTKLPVVSDKAQLPYVEATLLEVLRMSSVAPLIVRCPAEDTKLGTYDIPKNTFTIFNTYSANYSEVLWNNPDDFDPSRFLDSRTNQIVNMDKIIPFGIGKRVCIGEILARASLFTFFTGFMQRYSFETSPGHPEPDMKGQPGITLSPLPYYARIQPRLSISNQPFK